MSYTIYDTSNTSTATCGALDEAIEKVESVLRLEENRGCRIEREIEGRWAIYNGTEIGLLWIEADNGSVVSFAR